MGAGGANKADILLDGEWHVALESVSAKCNDEPFLYTTVNCNAVGKASFSAGVLVSKENPSGRFIEETDGQCVQ